MGPKRTSFTVHAAIVADLSAPLNALINGSMGEAKDGVVVLDDMNEQTFVRFCEYAYLGDYTPAQRGNVPSIEKKALSLADDEDTFPSFGLKKKKKGKSPFAVEDLGDETHCRHCGGRTEQIFWDEFQKRDYLVIGARFQAGENREGDIDVLLCHAHVYVFADKYDIANLRILALDKLHHALQSFKAVGGQTKSLVELLRFSYSNDNTRDNSVGQDLDDLRSMVINYVARVFEKVAGDDIFLELMEEGGPLARDLTNLLVKRITLRC